MNFLKDVVLGLVGLIALNSMGYLAMNTSMGYDIIVYGCIIVVELLVLMWFVKWMRPSVEEETSSRGKRAGIIYNDAFSDYDYEDSYDDCHGNTCDCGDCLNDDQKVELEEARQNLDDAIAYLDRIMGQSPRAEENTINVDSKTTNKTAREECEEDGPSHNDPTGETGDPGVVESDITVENESDTTSLDDIIAEVKNF